VASAGRIGRGLVRVERKDMPPTVVGILSANPVSPAELRDLLATQPRPEFILNIPKNAAWTGQAITELEAGGIAFGKMYDLYRALRTEGDFSTYRNPEFDFVNAGTAQQCGFCDAAFRPRLSGPPRSGQ
jgi:hypothetical protein